jgi:hypothetical protein
MDGLPPLGHDGLKFHRSFIAHEIETCVRERVLEVVQEVGVKVDEVIE